MNIDNELQKIKDLLDKTTTLKSEIIPYFDWGNKVSIKVNEMIDNKKTTIEYYFHIKYCKDRDNYCNAEYFLSCDYDYKDGGGGYGEKYESLDDFKNTRQYKELLEKYGKNKNIQADKKTTIESNNINFEELSLFDLETDTQDNQLSLFDEIKENDSVEDLLSYGIDEYYKEHFSTGSPLLYDIYYELCELPNYKEYYSKLVDYLKTKIRVEEKPNFLGNSKDGKEYMYFVDDFVRIYANRQDKPIFCLSMVQKGLLD